MFCLPETGRRVDVCRGEERKKKKDTEGFFFFQDGKDYFSFTRSTNVTVAVFHFSRLQNRSNLLKKKKKKYVSGLQVFLLDDGLHLLFFAVKDGYFIFHL